MGDEAKITLSEYFRAGVHIRFFGNKDIAQKIADFISNGKYNYPDPPDIAIQYKDECLVIEHFEFDCYENKHGGSENKKEQGRIEREMNSLQSPQQGIYYRDRINGNSSYKHYIENVESIFTKHYLRLPNYRKNLIKHHIIDENTPTKFAFLIEDVSPLGAQAYDDNGKHPICLAFSNEFLDLMRISTDIDYVIACSSQGSDKYIWLIIKESLEEYVNNRMDYINMFFIDYTPQIIGFRAEVPHDRVGDQ